jgi:hypothetical protein
MLSLIFVFVPYHEIIKFGFRLSLYFKKLKYKSDLICELTIGRIQYQVRVKRTKNTRDVEEWEKKNGRKRFRHKMQNKLIPIEFQRALYTDNNIMYSQ